MKTDKNSQSIDTKEYNSIAERYIDNKNTEQIIGDYRLVTLEAVTLIKIWYISKKNFRLDLQGNGELNR